MPPLTVSRKLVWLTVAVGLGLAGTGVGALVTEVISASKDRAVQAVEASKGRAIQAVQMAALIESIDQVGVKLDTSVKIGTSERELLRSRIVMLEMHAARMDGDVAGILRALDEAKDRLTALERGDMPLRIINPEGG